MIPLLSNRILMRCLGPLRKLKDSNHQRAHQNIQLHMMTKHLSHIHLTCKQKIRPVYLIIPYFPIGSSLEGCLIKALSNQWHPKPTWNDLVSQQLKKKKKWSVQLILNCKLGKFSLLIFIKKSCGKKYRLLIILVTKCSQRLKRLIQEVIKSRWEEKFTIFFLRRQTLMMCFWHLSFRHSYIMKI